MMPPRGWRMLRLSAILATVALLASACAACGGAPNLPAGTRACVGFPADVCARQVADARARGDAPRRRRRLPDRLHLGALHAEQGEGNESVAFADGTGREWRVRLRRCPMGTPPEATLGPLPVTPACLGVPAGWCAEQARAGAEMIADWSTIATITVRCTSTCTTSMGDGETRVLLRDGTVQTQGWSYNGELPPERALTTGRLRTGGPSDTTRLLRSAATPRPRAGAPARAAGPHGAPDRMISTGELRKGVVIELDGDLWQILDYHHIKMGRGSAQVRIKLRNVKKGSTVEKSFQAGEKWPRAQLDRRADPVPLPRRRRLPLHGDGVVRAVPPHGRRRSTTSCRTSRTG